MATTVVTEQEGNGFYIAQFKTIDIALFSYYVESDKSAFLIDPTLDTNVYREFLNKRGATLKYVVLTHYHADFLSGHTNFEVPIIMGPTSKSEVNKFEVTELKDGELFMVGNITATCIHTPGHTNESSCFILQDAEKKDVCIFSGDTVFLGDVGRPDLAASHDVTREDLAGWLFDSVQKLKKLNGEMRIYPGHGSGSACGKSIGAGNFCTLGKQFESNYGFLMKEREEFVKQLTSGISEPPQYFHYDAKLNHIDPGNYDEILKKTSIPLNVEEFQKAASNSVVFDTRDDPKQVLIGTYWTLSKGPLTTWVTMMCKPEDPITLIADEGKSEFIISRLLRIGYFNILGFNNFKVSEHPGEKTNPKVFNGKEALEIEGRVHLDVRNKPEWKQTGVIEKSILIPLGQLKNRVEEVRGKQNIVINCRSGARARFAYSILANAGIKSVVMADMVNELEGMGHKFVKYEE